MKATEAVRIWEEKVSLPTYPAQAPDPNPMFVEKRVYQGSSGKVYPNPFTDCISLERSSRSYKAIYLENEYVQLMVLPEIGGRIHAGLDKTNGYNFFYRQNVIKPALVGLLGPWISGGVEFNWPQHHRPSTFMPVHAAMEHGEDGSATVWLSEHEPMNRMKGMVGICLHPGRSVVEAKVRLYNRTPFMQTFLWWANVAVRVHEEYQAFFPPDVHFVADHAKRAVSHFPVAKNFYYGVDYRSGVDLRWYKNIPVPTSYMVTKSDYDFFGGYDHGQQAGFVHVADRHIAPGKKMWTWGSGEFGQAWDRNLTDEDGPYIELMAGVYTDNQPDFSWLTPYETKTFSQFWYPIQKIGPVSCANVHAALSVAIDEGKLLLGLCPSELISGGSIQVLRMGEEVFRSSLNAAPGEPWMHSFSCNYALDELLFQVRDGKENLLLAYRPELACDVELPPPATEPASPAEIQSTDELYITGLHLEQYRHATRSPEPYWEEALRRDSGDARVSNAMGLVALKRGEFNRAENFFQTAIERLTKRNPNPRDGEPFYNLGLALIRQLRLGEAYQAFSKAAWNGAWRGPSEYALAQIDSLRGNPQQALVHLKESLQCDAVNLKALGLKASLLRRLGRKEEAGAISAQALRLDPLDFRNLAEGTLLDLGSEVQATLPAQLNGDVQTALDVAYDYAEAGLYDDASRWLRLFLETTGVKYPMIFYTLAWLAAHQNDEQEAQKYRARAAVAPPLYCFPARLEEMVLLEDAIRRNPADFRAHYYLGNFYYDRKRYKDAIECWRTAAAGEPSFSIPWRNLGIAEYNVLHDAKAAQSAYEKACAANPMDARLFYELDQLKKRTGARPDERLSEFESHAELVVRRDDLSVEHAALLNLTGRQEQALALLLARRFSPWEGGEGLVSGQYVQAHIALGRKAMQFGDLHLAAQHFRDARIYPENLGEGKHLLTLERQLDFMEGLAQERAGDLKAARELYIAAAAPLSGYSIHSYYRARALHKLGNEDESRSALEELREYAELHENDGPAIDYFATSLPNLLLFEDDLKKRNFIECKTLEAYAELGLAKEQHARELFREVLQLDPSYQDAAAGLSVVDEANAMQADARA